MISDRLFAIEFVEEHYGTLSILVGIGIGGLVIYVAIEKFRIWNSWNSGKHGSNTGKHGGYGDSGGHDDADDWGGGE